MVGKIPLSARRTESVAAIRAKHHGGAQLPLKVYNQKASREKRVSCISRKAKAGTADDVLSADTLVSRELAQDATAMSRLGGRRGSGRTLQCLTVGCQAHRGGTPAERQGLWNTQESPSHSLGDLYDGVTMRAARSCPPRRVSSSEELGRLTAESGASCKRRGCGGPPFLLLSWGKVTGSARRLV